MTHRAIERERKRREAVSRWSASVAAATCLYRTLVRYNINIVRYRRGGLSLVYCRDCKRSVDDCEHFVAPIGSPHVTVFDPKVQSLAYEKKSMILEVEFKNGQVWQLFGIKPEIYEELLHATLSSFLKFLAHRYRAAPVRRLRPGAIVPTSEPCPACQRPMTEMHKTSGGTIRVLWHCDKCNQSLWRTYQRESIRERRRR